MDRAEHDELVTIRTQLTVALLAVTQLQRKHAAASADADRLLAYVSTALARITCEVHTVEALMARLEERAAMRTDLAQSYAHRRTGADDGLHGHD